MEEITQKAYWTEVEALAKDCVERFAAGEDLYEAVNAACDGHHWIIYTFYHHQILQISDQDVSARFEEMGGPASKDWASLVMHAAYLALEGDVLDRAQRMQSEES